MAQYRTDQNKLDFTNNRTRYEVFMLSDRLTPSGNLTDAFGKLRTSTGYTLFDSSHRYQDNGKWAESVTGVANSQYQLNESVVNMNVGSASGDKIYRESKRVFSYQPGKSLLIMSTFAFNTPKANLRQRVGFFNSQNGVFLENDGVNNYLVLRSNVSGTPSESRILQTDWNKDKFDGTGYSAQGAGSEHAVGLDVSKTNILWIDVEWLGVGDVRCGFVVDGKFVTAHIFHNDNKNTTTYMTTATLPCRYELENLAGTGSASTLKQICSTVISEGGYELQGRSRSIGLPLATPKTLPTAGTFTPVISIRLKDSFKDAVVVLTDLEIVGFTNNSTYRYKLIVGGSLTGASWVSAATDSPIEYDTTATAVANGRDAQVGYVIVGAGSGAASVNLGRNDLFAYQLERDPFAASNNGLIITLAATSLSNGDTALGALTWEEVS